MATPAGAVVDYTYSLASTHDFISFEVQKRLVRKRVSYQVAHP